MNVKIPYGESDFEKVVTENYLYVDKTKYIELLENDASYELFIRPRRFGKSLFLSMLRNYYDINQKDRFEELFGNLYIGSNPTEKRNSYLILKLDFSNIKTFGGKEELIESFDERVIESVKDFFIRYYNILDCKNDKLQFNNSIGAINFAASMTSNVGKKIFVLIDEYDNFANDLITTNEELYYDIISSQGYIRTFYKALKALTTTTVDRIFMTGVSPILLDDLTSGFNITKNLTLEKMYNEMMGFTLPELETLMERLCLFNIFSRDILIDDMKQYYNGYLFSEDSKQRLFNPNMVLYFFDNLVRYNKYPKNMLDLNIKTDYKKLETLAFNFKDEETIETILAEGQIETTLVQRFNLEYMYDRKENFVSLLFYMGMLTIKESFLGDVTLVIPNIAMKEIYWEYFKLKLAETHKLDIDNKKIKAAINEMAVKGNCNKFIQCLKKSLESLSNRDLVKFDEKHIKILILSIFMNNIYIANSEYEVEEGFIDILLSKNKAFAESINYEWLIELKYIREKDRNAFDKIKSEGLKQISKYKNSDKLRKTFNLDNMKKLLIVVVGKKDVYVEEEI